MRKNLNEAWGNGAMDVNIWGTFAPQGAGVPTITKPTKRRRFSVVRTSAGLYTVTLNDAFFEFEVVSLRLSLAAATTREIQLQAQTPTTFQIQIVDAANTAQDIAANAANNIAFHVIGVNSNT